MNSDFEDSEIQSTVWLKKKDGSWLGCKVLSGSEIQNIGSTLVSSYQTLDKVKALVGLKTIWKVENAPAECKQEDSEFFPECGDSLMKVQAKDVSDYCYIFDEATLEWRFGINMSQPLKKLVEFINRNGEDNE